MADRLVISASPRAMGKSARVAKELVGILSERFPSDQIELVRLPDFDIRYCAGCNTCRESEECFVEDDMNKIIEYLQAASFLYVVSPIYFAGPPANYKAMLDRLQPFFWTWEKGRPKRSAILIAIGDGGDPHGFDPLVTCTRSALSLVGFEVIKVLPYIGPELKSYDIARDLAVDLG